MALITAINQSDSDSFNALRDTNVEEEFVDWSITDRAKHLNVSTTLGKVAMQLEHVGSLFSGEYQFPNGSRELPTVIELPATLLLASFDQRN